MCCLLLAAKIARPHHISCMIITRTASKIYSNSEAFVRGMSGEGVDVRSNSIIMKYPFPHTKSLLK